MTQGPLPSSPFAPPPDPQQATRQAPVVPPRGHGTFRPQAGPYDPRGTFIEPSRHHQLPAISVATSVIGATGFIGVTAAVFMPWLSFPFATVAGIETRLGPIVLLVAILGMVSAGLGLLKPQLFGAIGSLAACLTGGLALVLLLAIFAAKSGLDSSEDQTIEDVWLRLAVPQVGLWLMIALSGMAGGACLVMVAAPTMRTQARTPIPTPYGHHR